MEKIFTSVAVFAVALMVATAGLGLWLGDLHGQTDQAILRLAQFIVSLAS